MPRMTRSNVYEKFKTLCHVADKTTLNQISIRDKESCSSTYCGAWHLEYKPGSGYWIEQLGKDGIEYPMGDSPRGAAEMVRTMDFAIGVLQEFKVASKIRVEERRRINERNIDYSGNIRAG